MPKLPASAIGIDLGKHSFKAVLLHRKGAMKFSLAGYAIRPIAGTIQDSSELSNHLKLLLKEVGGTSKVISLSASLQNAMVRMIEQPETPVELLRDAIKLNSTTLLNQDCKEFVLDCDLAKPASPPVAPSKDSKKEDAKNEALANRIKRLKYVVGGLPRAEVNMITEACGKSKISPENLQLAPLCTYNAFCYNYPDTVQNGAFMLVDVGHKQTTVILGSRSEMVLVRTIDFGGQNFVEALCGESAIEETAAILLVQQGDAGMGESARSALSQLARELTSSIAFIEGQREEGIGRIFISGALAKADMPLQILSDEVNLPCEVWNPFANCENNLSKLRKTTLQNDVVSLNVAFGAALEVMTPKD